MRIDRKYKIWKGVTTGDDRPILNHVLVSPIDDVCDYLNISDDDDNKTEDKWAEIVVWLNRYVNDDYQYGIAAATNGFLLSIVPVTFDEDDKPGILPTAVFKQGNTRKKKGYEFIDLRPHKVKRADGGDLTTYDLALAGNVYIPRAVEHLGKFPNFVRVLHQAIFDEADHEATYDLRIIDAIRASTGLDHVKFLKRRTSPGLIQNWPEMKNFPRLPLGVIMPMHHGR